MKKVVIVELGTFCDLSLFDVINAGFAKKYNVYLITHRTVRPTNVEHMYKYVLPSCVYTKTDYAFLSHESNFLHILKEFLLNPAVLRFKLAIERCVRSVICKIKPALLVMHYGIYTLGFFRKECFPPTMIIYFAPCIPCNLPVLFDSILKKSSFALYGEAETSDAIALKSWTTFQRRQQIVNGQLFGQPHVTTALMNAAHDVTHVFCWEKYMMPNLTFIGNPRVNTIGTLIKPISSKRIKETRALRYLSTLQNIAFITFGSFNSSVTRSFIVRICDILVTLKYSVLLHNVSGTIPNVYHVSGFIPYNQVVPKTRLVIFTGSLCLQTICLYYQVPMIYVPQIAEQYFWARTYEFKTRVPFITRRSTYLAIQVAIESSKTEGTRAYLRRVSSEMQKSKPIDNLLAIAHSLDR